MQLAVRKLVVWLFALFLPCVLLADETTGKGAGTEEKSSADELEISAERMEMQLDGQTVELTGNVRVQDSVMSLTARKMMIYLAEVEKTEEKDKGKEDEGMLSSSMKLQRIEADGDVTLRKLDGTESVMGDGALRFAAWKSSRIFCSEDP